MSMANNNYRNLQEFRSLLLRLVEDESKLKPDIVTSMYKQLFIEPYIESYADEEINETYYFLVSIKSGYGIADLKQLQDYFKDVDTMTQSLLRFVKGGINDKAIEQVKEKVKTQFKNPRKVNISVLEAIHLSTNINSNDNVRGKLCKEAERTCKIRNGMAAHIKDNEKKNQQVSSSEESQYLKLNAKRKRSNRVF
jgi:hypothetical protein